MIRLGNVVENCLNRAALAGRKPTRLLFGPEVWPVFKMCDGFPQINNDSAMKGDPPIYRGLPCYKMHAPGVAVVT